MYQSDEGLLPPSLAATGVGGELCKGLDLGGGKRRLEAVSVPGEQVRRVCDGLLELNSQSTADKSFGIGDGSALHLRRPVGETAAAAEQFSRVRCCAPLRNGDRLEGWSTKETLILVE